MDFGRPEPQSAWIEGDRQGIRPFKSPTNSGCRLEARFLRTFVDKKRGIRKVSGRSQGKIPSILMPMITIKIPAIIFKLPWRK